MDYGRISNDEIRKIKIVYCIICIRITKTGVEKRIIFSSKRRWCTHKIKVDSFYCPSCSNNKHNVMLKEGGWSVGFFSSYLFRNLKSRSLWGLRFFFTSFWFDRIFLLRIYICMYICIMFERLEYDDWDFYMSTRHYCIISLCIVNLTLFSGCRYGFLFRFNSFNVWIVEWTCSINNWCVIWRYVTAHNNRDHKKKLN